MTEITKTNTPAIAPEKVITVSQAVQIVKKVAADELRAAKKIQRERVARLEDAVGGSVKRVDETVVAQAKTLMTRIALIAKNRNASHATSTTLEGIVKKLGGIVGELEAFMLTDKAAGLFETLNDHEFIKSGKPWGTAEDNPLSYVGPKSRKAAEAALEGYVVVADPPKGKGAKNVTPDPSTGRTVAQLAGESLEDDEDDIDDEDAEDDEE
jgi:hypothetical protein